MHGWNSALAQGFLLIKSGWSNSSSSTRYYCVLYGTTLFAFDSEEDSKFHLKIVKEIELIGVSNWNVKSNSSTHVDAFTFVSHLSHTYYAFTESSEKKHLWIAAIRCALEASFGDKLLKHLKPPKSVYPSPTLMESIVCLHSGNAFGYKSPIHCIGCGGAFLFEYCKDHVPLVHSSYENRVRLCLECSLSQHVINLYKVINSCYLMQQHFASMDFDALSSSDSYLSLIVRRSVNDAKFDGLRALCNIGQISADELRLMMEEEIKSSRRSEEMSNKLLSFDDDDMPSILKSIESEFLSNQISTNLDQHINYLLSLDNIDDIMEDYLLIFSHIVFRSCVSRNAPILFKLESLTSFLLGYCSSNMSIASRFGWILTAYLKDVESPLLASKSRQVMAEAWNRRVYLCKLLIELEATCTGQCACLTQGSKSFPDIVLSPSNNQRRVLGKHIKISFRNRRLRFGETFPDAWSCFHCQYDEGLQRSPVGNVIDSCVWENEEVTGADGDDNQGGFDDDNGSSQPDLKCEVLDDEDDDAVTPSTLMVRNQILVSSQNNFVKKLCQVVDSLRFVEPRSRRHDVLRESLELIINSHYSIMNRERDVFEMLSHPLGYLPSMGHPSAVISVCLDDFHVFNTKARCPTLLIIETRKLALETAPRKASDMGRKSETMLSQSDVLLLVSEETSKLSIRSSLTDEQQLQQLGLQSPTRVSRGDLTAVSRIVSSEFGSNEDDKYLSFVTRKALTMLNQGRITLEEYLLLVEKDKQFLLEQSKEDLAYWMRNAFGETWDQKRNRLRLSSNVAKMCESDWDVDGIIVKSNDDLRQEAYVIHLFQLCSDIFLATGLDLWVKLYKIVPTSQNTGFVEVIRDSISIDALKKSQGFVNLSTHFNLMYTSPPLLDSAKMAFVSSMAAYSLMCYVFSIKDRHNGNILIDRYGHIIHIDFGFILGIAPGGSFSVETVPFKLTSEMIDVMGGIDGRYCREFLVRFCLGFLALRDHIDVLVSDISIMAQSSPFPAFQDKNTDLIISKLTSRLRPDLSNEDSIRFAIDLVRQSLDAFFTRQYDHYQFITNHISM